MSAIVQKMVERKNLLQAVRADYAKAAADLDMLKGEVIKSLRGESSFPQDLLGTMVAEAEKSVPKSGKFEAAQAAYDEDRLFWRP